MNVLDSWRLAVGTLTAIPVAPPRDVTRGVAGLAMFLAPVAFAPIAITMAFILWVGPHVHISVPLSAMVAMVVLVVGSRAIHLDGLADTVDGISAAKTGESDQQRSLAVMRAGDIGPMGVAAIVLVLLVQWIALAELTWWAHGWLLGPLVVCGSRVALTTACMQGVPAARPDGLGAAVAGSVPLPVTFVAWAAVGGVLSVAYMAAGFPWHHAAAAAVVGFATSALVVWWCVRKLGGITGDVLGATVEISLAMMLLAAG